MLGTYTATVDIGYDGGAAAKDLTVQIDTNSNSVCDSCEEIVISGHTWNCQSYFARLSYDSLQVEVAMVVAFDSDSNSNVQMGTFDFAASLDELVQVKEDGYDFWLADKAQAIISRR